MTDISGKTAFVTGGASGLGLSMARAFANRGASVMLADINAEGLVEAAAKLRAETNAEIDSVVCDVARVDAVREAAEKTIDRFGKVHLVAQQCWRCARRRARRHSNRGLALDRRHQSDGRGVWR